MRRPVQEGIIPSLFGCPRPTRVVLVEAMQPWTFQHDAGQGFKERPSSHSPPATAANVRADESTQIKISAPLARISKT